MTALFAATGNGKELWYLTRGSGSVALVLLTVSVLLGVMSSVRWRSARWPRFLVSGLHRNVTLIAIAFTAVHVITTIADAFAPIGLLDAVIPFLSPYRPFWLGLGTVAFDLLLALVATSLARRRIGFRAWRAVHWLAYASWPVALLHSLGTGSDARSGWLAVLGVLCAVTVLASVVWRLLAARDALPIVRAGATVATLGVLAGLLVWAQNGPLRRGWAARAGTPSTLLAAAARGQEAAVVTRTPAASRRPRARAAARHADATLPGGSFRAAFAGRLRETDAPQGLVVVSIDGRARGGFAGRVHVALRGIPLDGGGVEMTDSVVGLLPQGASAWAAGHVVGLDGQRILAEVRPPGGGAVRLLLDLRIQASGAVTGSLHGRPAGSSDEGSTG